MVQLFPASTPRLEVQKSPEVSFGSSPELEILVPEAGINTQVSQILCGSCKSLTRKTQSVIF